MTLMFNNHPENTYDLLYRCFPRNSKCFATLREDGVLEISLKEPPLTHAQKIAYAKKYLLDNRFPQVFENYRNVVTCYTIQKGKTLCGHAACSPSDKYDHNIGCAIALARALKEEEKVLPLMR